MKKKIAKKSNTNRIIKTILRIITIILLICITSIIFLKFPSNSKDWNSKQKILASAIITNDTVTIINIRDARLINDTVQVKYYNETFELSKIKRLWFAVEPFMKWEGAAHTFFSFEFENNKYVTLSVEARAEKNEEYGLIKGLFNSYELIYVFASEHDAIGLRTMNEKHNIYFYPINTTKDKATKIFLSTAEYANRLNEKPEFYNTLTDSCTTALIKHANEITPGRIPFSLKRFIPGYADRIAYSLGLIDTELEFKDIRVHYSIGNVSNKYYNDPEYSQKIREGID